MSQKRKKELKIKTSREINANNSENYAISPERLNITYQAISQNDWVLQSSNH
jgi:hypothetical protein